ncbi:MAG: cytochrome c1 [Gammaproteobacteria bacterium]|nr:cytochrome c1 [Gammaproteobacteria bacterium]
MKKILVAILLVLAPCVVMASGSKFKLEDANIDLSDKASLQRGAKYFVNYCMGCHSLSYQRYNIMGRDLDLTKEELQNNLIFTRSAEGESTKVGALMETAMTPAYAEKVFGIVPMNLSVVARSRSPDWLYTYLKSFYVNDAGKVDNPLLPGVSMPHVLWELQGWQKAITHTQKDAEGNEHITISSLEMVTPGQLSATEYDAVVRDLTNFLTYTADPRRAERHATGIWVLLFLVVFTAMAYALKKEYWRDIS